MQETKMEKFGFSFHPSIGRSGCLLTLWDTKLVVMEVLLHRACVICRGEVISIKLVLDVLFFQN